MCITQTLWWLQLCVRVCVSQSFEVASSNYLVISKNCEGLWDSRLVRLSFKAHSTCRSIKTPFESLKWSINYTLLKNHISFHSIVDQSHTTSNWNLKEPQRTNDTYCRVNLTWWSHGRTTCNLSNLERAIEINLLLLQVCFFLRPSKCCANDSHRYCSCELTELHTEK